MGVGAGAPMADVGHAIALALLDLASLLCVRFSVMTLKWLSYSVV